MARHECQCCLHPDRAVIDAALLEGSETLKALAVTFGLSAFSLSRHKAKHLPVAVSASETNSDSLAAEATLWRERAHQIWNQAERDADVRGLAQACQTGLRALEMAHRQKEREAEAAPDADDGKLTIQDFDRIVEKWEHIQQELGAEKAAEAAENARRMRLPNLTEIFFDCVHDEELRMLLEMTARDYKNSKDEKQNEPVSQSATN